MTTSSNDAEESVVSACETSATSLGYRLKPSIFRRTFHKRENVNSIRRRLQEEWDREQRALRAKNSWDREEENQESDHEWLDWAETEPTCGHTSVQACDADSRKEHI